MVGQNEEVTLYQNEQNVCTSTSQVAATGKEHNYCAIHSWQKRKKVEKTNYSVKKLSIYQKEFSTKRIERM